MFSVGRWAVNTDLFKTVFCCVLFPSVLWYDINYNLLHKGSRMRCVGNCLKGTTRWENDCLPILPDSLCWRCAPTLHAQNEDLSSSQTEGLHWAQCLLGDCQGLQECKVLPILSRDVIRGAIFVKKDVTVWVAPFNFASFLLTLSN